MTDYIWRGMTGLGEWVLFYYFTLGLERRRKRRWETWLVAAAFFVRTVMKARFPARDIPGSLMRNGVFYVILYGSLFLLYKVQNMYAAFLAAVMLFSWGVWKNVVSRFALGQLGLVAYLGLGEEAAVIFCRILEIGCMGVTTAVMKRWVIAVDSGRTLTGREAFLSLFPAFVNYMTMVVLYYMAAFEASSISPKVARAMVCLMALHACSSLIILAATERFFQSKIKDGELKRMEVQMAFQYQCFEERRQMDETMKILCHDMNNHLNAIKHLTSEQAVSQYVGKLLQETKDVQNHLDTGNAFLNVLLEQKQSLCSSRKVTLTAYVNFKNTDFISSMDMNVLFSNAIDNALEAAVCLGDPDRRQIQVRGGRVGNCLVAKFRNPYEGEVCIRRGKPVTTKKDKAFHGIGLDSVRRVLEKYGGTMTIQAENGWFELKWMIPDGPVIGSK